MKIHTFNIPGLILIKPQIFKDERGFFLESWSYQKYCKIGIDVNFLQDNHSLSHKSTLRGLHYQSGKGQAKLVRVIQGKILDVAVDIRPESSTFGKWESVELDSENHHQLYIPEGFAHGFVVLSEIAQIVYKVSTPYNPSTEKTISWSDPDLSIDWGINNPTLSDRDRNGESFKSFARKICL